MSCISVITLDRTIGIISSSSVSIATMDSLIWITQFAIPPKPASD
uniref:Uncharacterized protein n=1 Tax=Ciona intestinalis TaxID=7719 RepID=H2XN08_CIOIN